MEFSEFQLFENEKKENLGFFFNLFCLNVNKGGLEFF